MPHFHLARLTYSGAAPALEQYRLERAARLAFTDARGRFLDIQLEAAPLTLTCSARAEAWHYHRWADATVKPLPPQPGPLALQPGDAYVAVSPSAARLADSPALARFIHLRDDFNAEKLAVLLMAHLLENADSTAEEVTVIVIEAR